MDTERIKISTSLIKTFCEKHHIQKLSLFGSVLRGDFNEQSDIDVLVEFDPNHIPGFDFFIMEEELSGLLGRKVDFLTKNFLGPQILPSVMSEKMVIYEQT